MGDSSILDVATPHHPPNTQRSSADPVPSSRIFDMFHSCSNRPLTTLETQRTVNALHSLVVGKTSPRRKSRLAAAHLVWAAVPRYKVPVDFAQAFLRNCAATKDFDGLNVLRHLINLRLIYGLIWCCFFIETPTETGPYRALKSSTALAFVEPFCKSPGIACEPNYSHRPCWCDWSPAWNWLGSKVPLSLGNLCLRFDKAKKNPFPHVGKNNLNTSHFWDFQVFTSKKIVFPASLLSFAFESF